MTQAPGRTAGRSGHLGESLSSSPMPAPVHHGRWLCHSAAQRSSSAYAATAAPPSSAAKPSRQDAYRGRQSSRACARTLSAPCNWVMKASPQPPTARRATAAGARRGGGPPSISAIAGSHSRIGAGVSSTTLSVPDTSLASAAVMAVAASCAWMKQKTLKAWPTPMIPPRTGSATRTPRYGEGRLGSSPHARYPQLDRRPLRRPTHVFNMRLLNDLGEGDGAH